MDWPTMLTDHQRRALSYRNHVSVTANAGAGKTTVLVRRYLEILLKTGEPVSTLVAITFTENAAGELRKRIAELIEAGMRAGSDRKEHQLLERARDELSSAHIGTIHSFCGQLLREFPVEADVDASFTVLEGVDRELLLRDSLRESLQSFLAGGANPEDREELLTALRLLGRGKVLRFLSAWLEKRELIDRMTQPEGPLAEGLSEGEILDSRRRLVYQDLAASVEEPRWKEALGRLLNRATGKKAGEVAGLLSRSPVGGTPEDTVRWYRELSLLLFTASGSLRKDWTGPQTDGSGGREDTAILTSHWKGLGRMLGAMTAEGADDAEKLLLRLVRILLKVNRKTLDAYALRKSEFGQLDFDDLLIKTRDLLRQETVRLQLARKFKYIMIDEYQDTDQLQYEIVRLLISDFGSGNLFIVGDPKQSIFRFRNADVQIFEQTKRAIEAASGPAESTVSLAESFRLLTGLADFVNRVFSRPKPGECSRFGTGHEELIKGRSNPAEGRVELLLASAPPRPEGWEEGSTGAPDALALECRMIAGRIAGMVKKRFVVYDSANEAPRSITFNDVAILLRSRTNLRSLEKALVEHNIPYILSGGIGFYQTQEVLDFLSFFQFLLNPEDDVALAGLLRSPFFAVSDGDLFEISREPGGQTFWEKTGHYAGHNHGGRVLRAVHILQEDLELAGRLPIPFLVQRILLQTGWHGTVSGLPLGNQNVANVSKLLRIARDYEGRGFNTLYDFAERLKTLAERDPHEGQAPPGITENCVQVLTVHGAKGLEFPVVFFPFLDHEFQFDSPPYLDPRLGIAFKPPDPSDPAEEVNTPFFEFMRRISIHETEAEEERILYVGCTRARDALVLSGQLGVGMSQPSYLKWILESLGLNHRPVRTGDIVLPEIPLKMMEWMNGAGKIREIGHALMLSLLCADGMPEVIPYDSEAGQRDSRLPELWIDPIEGRVHGEIFSATQIKIFLECPAKYYLKYCLGLPEAHTFPISSGDDEEPDDTLRGELEGSLTHLILKDIVSAEVTGREVEEKARRLVSNAPMLGKDEREGAAGAISRNVLSFVHSDFGRQALSSAETKTEFTLNAVFGDDYVAGTIDRMYLDGHGNWNILDYKTDRIGPEELDARSELYKPQLALYAWLIRRTYGQESVRASLQFLLYPDSPIHFVFDSVEAERFENTMRSVIHRIKAKQFVRSTPVCPTCTYRSGDDCLLRFG